MKKWRLFALVLLLLLVVGVGAGAWWWFVIHPKSASKSPVLTSEISLPTFTVSITKKDGMTHYLVLDMTVTVHGSQKLPKDWLKNHTPRVRAAILSSLLNLPNIGQINTDKSVRAAVRKAVSVDMQPVLSSKFPVSGVYITKLIVQ
ncbi:flagellar basal body-associated FliL family protein [Acidithiobacillus thiooxidans]|uniref:flagellar basal body-associated FliL family protein n=1 Tax=Acidithiobacillus thiooxidans TaxID=930 RepID=UPI001C075BB0|nr:flagellar basal body-associated FliL family protein [Acidithiobacillus thiooxidans]MBU2793130.1 flagellar basal body-associated FliL family protein [Acidithiobacillus thiooxidans]